MSKKTNVRFNPSIDHLARKEYGLMALPMDTPVERVRVGNTTMAVIPKKYLGVGRYQRPVDAKRVAKINQKWQPDFGQANVAEIECNGKFYYAITDGQQRTCANPFDTVDCIITNTHTPVDNALMQNDKTLVKAWNFDNQYWGNYYKCQTEDTQWVTEDQGDVMYIYNVFKNFGFNPQPLKDSKQDDFGRHIGKIYDIYIKYVYDQINTTYADSPDVAVRLRREILTDIVEIMIEVFSSQNHPLSYRNKMTQAWNGLMVFLRRLNWDYDTQEVIDSLKQATYKPHKGRNEIVLEGPKDWEANVKHHSFDQISFVRDKWAALLMRVYKFAVNAG